MLVQGTYERAVSCAEEQPDQTSLVQCIKLDQDCTRLYNASLVVRNLVSQGAYTTPERFSHAFCAFARITLRASFVSRGTSPRSSLSKSNFSARCIREKRRRSGGRYLRVGRASEGRNVAKPAIQIGAQPTRTFATAFARGTNGKRSSVGPPCTDMDGKTFAGMVSSQPSP